MQSGTSTVRKLGMLIDGDWVGSAAREVITSIDPANREPVAEVPRGKAADIDRAVKAARRAFEGEKGLESLKGYTQLKNVAVKLHIETAKPLDPMAGPVE